MLIYFLIHVGGLVKRVGCLGNIMECFHNCQMDNIQNYHGDDH